MYVSMYFLHLGITFTGPHYIIMVEGLLPPSDSATMSECTLGGQGMVNEYSSNIR